MRHLRNTIYAPIYATVPRESPVMTSFQDIPHSEKMAENNTQKVVQFEYLPAPPILPSDHALYKTETFKEKLFRKAKQNPFIPVGKSTDLCYYVRVLNGTCISADLCQCSVSDRLLIYGIMVYALLLVLVLLVYKMRLS